MKQYKVTKKNVNDIKPGADDVPMPMGRDWELASTTAIRDCVCWTWVRNESIKVEPTEVPPARKSK